jgi:3D (Asp-Asp-Asp) domain-containing protein
MFTVPRFLAVVTLAIGLVGTAAAEKERANSNNLRVTATAYNSHSSQTDATPNIAAWGDRLRPGMKAIAISRDLLHQHGLGRGDKVRIVGLGEYTVLDKMNSRWRKKIDIYMGNDRYAAKRWGRRQITIQWQ